MELLIDVVNMSGDRMHTDAESVRDLLVIITVRQQLKHVLFARREALRLQVFRLGLVERLHHLAGIWLVMAAPAGR